MIITHQTTSSNFPKSKSATVSFYCSCELWMKEEREKQREKTADSLGSIHNNVRFVRLGCVKTKLGWTGSLPSASLCFTPSCESILTPLLSGGRISMKSIRLLSVCAAVMAASSSRHLKRTRRGPRGPRRFSAGTVALWVLSLSGNLLTLSNKPVSLPKPAYVTPSTRKEGI